ncbi:hypothetical protein LPJ56_006644, partial [Coemansia sp. RSA 2599]
MSAGMATSRATDPLNDIGSPANLQYLQFAIAQSPFFMGEGIAPIASPSSVALGLPPKRSQQQPAQQAQAQAQASLAPQIRIVSAASPSSAAAASALALVSHRSASGLSQQSATQVLSLSPEDPLAGFSHPLQVFRTPEMSKPQDLVSEQNTPNLQLLEDADALGGAIRVLSPRTQNAQAGLSLLAASASYAQGSSDMLGISSSVGGSASSAGSVGSLVESQRAMVIGSPFLNARGENATLMSQPHNSLAQQLSPPMLNPDVLHGQQQLLPAVSHTITAGRLTRNRSLLRQSSGLTSASFHNDLVPPANESFFAPLDEVCSENDSQQQAQAQAQQAAAPPVGAQLSPAQRFPSAFPKQRPWLTSP